MASQGCRRCPQPQHQHCPHCPLRRHCHHCPLHNHHSDAINFFKPHFAPLPLKTLPNFELLRHRQQPIPSHVPISQELEHIELDGKEEDDDPVFVLTDEWREFFAQSEARRKLEKKKKKKQGKKGNK